MKVAIICDSLLLKKSLEKFLHDMIVPYKQCDIVISDRKIKIDKPVVIVGNKGDIAVPFSKSNLIMELEKFYFNKYKQESKTKKSKTKNRHLNNETIEDIIDKIADDYKKELKKVIREYYKDA